MTLEQERVCKSVASVFYSLVCQNVESELTDAQKDKLYDMQSSERKQYVNTLTAKQQSMREMFDRSLDETHFTMSEREYILSCYDSTKTLY